MKILVKILFLMLPILQFGCQLVRPNEVAKLTGSPRILAPQHVIARYSGTGDEWVLDASISPDSKMVLLANDEGHITIWHLDRGTRNMPLADQDHWPSKVAWSADGSLIATAGASVTPKNRLPLEHSVVSVWAADTGQLIKRIEGSRGSPTAVTFSADNSLLSWTCYTDDQRYELSVVSLNTGESAKVDVLQGTAFFHEAISFSADLANLYVFDGCWKISVTPYLKLERVRHFELPLLAYAANKGQGFAFGPVLKWPSSVDSLHAIYQFDLKTAVCQRRYDFSEQAETTPAQRMALAPDGNHLAIATRAGIRVIDVKSFLDVALLDTPEHVRDQATILSWASDSCHLVGGSGKGVYVWQIF